MLPASICMIVLLLIPPPPTSTLFPYTTLFRSPIQQHHWNDAGLSRLHEGEDLEPLIHGSEAAGEKREGVGFLHEVEFSGDRKSTRLNSSHTVISYAVFCLKKKKKNI